MRKGLWLTLEATAGMSVAETTAEMVEISSRLQILVQLKFNGILILCRPDSTANELESQYESQLQYSRR